MVRNAWIAMAGTALALASAAAGAHSGAEPRHVVVQPAPVVVHAPARSWVPAHWERRGHRQVWVEGHWVVHHSVHPVRTARWERGGRHDLDRDGIRDRHDRDIDGDGVPNRRDRVPTDPRWR